MSHPSWVCGLKQLANDADFVSQIVTPFVGVWIETEFNRGCYRHAEVTPFVGVWIET